MRISDWSSDVCSSDLPRIARLAPGGDRRGCIKHEPSVGHHQPSEHRSDAFGYRPAYEPAFGVKAGAIAFRNNLAVLHDEERAGFAHAGLFEPRIDGATQRRFTHAAKSEEHTSELQPI